MGFFQEKQNHNSAARLIFIIGSLWNMAMVSAMAFGLEDVNITGLTVFFTTIETALLAIKLGQKSLEVKR